MSDCCLDVVIIGAGLSGINAAYHLQTRFPGWNSAILEARGAIGGTWDFFRYPGIRTDSDCFTLGFPWHPWSGSPFADGPSISRYITEAAAKHGIDQRILFHHRVKAARWSDKSQRWTLDIDGTRQEVQSSYVVFGTGYYQYEKPLATTIPGLEQFKGQVVHPQFWPNELDYTGKRIIVIGSGATAVTLLPKLAEKASNVTMVQRSPTYILSFPPCHFLQWLPFRLVRIGWILVLQVFYWFCRAMPTVAHCILCLLMYAQLPAHISFSPHFRPRYFPWDQRLCVAPSGDFFRSLRGGRCQVKTSTIHTVTESGILLNTQEFLPADIIVTATGLQLQTAGGARIFTNGRACDLSEKFMWNGLMLQDIPNAFFMIGYPTTTWTLGTEVSAVLMCRLVEHLGRNGKGAAVPHLENAKDVPSRSLLNLNSTYVKAAEDRIPKAGYTYPWRPREHFLLDYLCAKYGRLERGLRFMNEI